MASSYTQSLQGAVQSEAPEGAMGPAEGAVVPNAPAWLRACAGATADEWSVRASSMTDSSLSLPVALCPFGRDVVAIFAAVPMSICIVRFVKVQSANMNLFLLAGAIILGIRRDCEHNYLLHAHYTLTSFTPIIQ